MALSSTTRTASLTATGGTAFPTGFKFLDPAHLTVTVDGATKTLGTDYTVSGAGDDAGGTVTFTAAPANGAAISITRDTPRLQPINFTQQGNYSPKTHSDSFDRQMMVAQDVEAEHEARLAWLESVDPGIASQNALASQNAAAASATASANSATASANSATSASGYATAAQTAQTAAEAARDAANATGKVYPDTTTGLAATAEGGYFTVPASTTNDSLILYQKSSGAAVEKKRYPATAFVTANANRLATVETTNLLFTRAGYRSTTGVFVADPNWGSTEFLPVGSVSVQNLALIGHTAVATVAFYDTNKAFISGTIAASNDALVSGYPAVPSNAAYVVFTCNRQSTYYASQSFNALISTTRTSNSLLVDFSKYATITGYINTNGTDGPSDTHFLRSGYFAISPADALDINLVGHTAISSVAFYDANKLYISSVVGTVNDAVVSKIAVAPANAAYFRLSFGNPATYAGAAGKTNAAFLTSDLYKAVDSNSSRVTVLENSSLLGAPYLSRRKLKLQPTDKILLYGDSISSTDYPWFQSSMANLTGATVYNGGFSGYNAAQLAANAQMQRIYDYGAKLVIAMVGGNDNGAAGTVGTFSGAIAGEAVVQETDISADYVGTCFIQAVSHIIRKFQATYYNIRQRAGLTGTETEAQKTALIDAVLKPVLVFATPLPQNRNNSSDTFSQAENWKRKRDAVVECCNKYKVHCVDLYSKVPFDMSVEPYWTSPTNTTTNNGVYFMDGLHPNKYGFEIIAEIHCAEIGL